MNKNGYADITEIQGRQIALVHKIIDENPAPDRVEDGWQVWEFGRNENREPVSKEPIRIIEKPEMKFKRRYYK